MDYIANKSFYSCMRLNCTHHTFCLLCTAYYNTGVVNDTYINTHLTVITQSQMLGNVCFLYVFLAMEHLILTHCIIYDIIYQNVPKRVFQK